MIIQLKNLEVVVEDAAYLAEHSPEDFAMARRAGLGASDAAIYLGAMKQFKTVDDLIYEKIQTTYTDAEREVAEKENVRKGADLEPIILNKFCKQFEVNVRKPKPMYRLKKHPYLTVNFDGILLSEEKIPIPVECKYVSPYANKYWDKGQAIDKLNSRQTPVGEHLNNVEAHCIERGKLEGIPNYYYVQLQQQMLALEAPYGYLTALFDKGWKLHTFQIFADTYVQQHIITEGYRVWNKIEALRNKAINGAIQFNLLK